MRYIFKSICTISILVFLSSLSLKAQQYKVYSLSGDSIVPHFRMSLQLCGKTYNAITDEQGLWVLNLSDSCEMAFISSDDAFYYLADTVVKLSSPSIRLYLSPKTKKLPTLIVKQQSRKLTGTAMRMEYRIDPKSISVHTSGNEAALQVPGIYRSEEGMMILGNKQRAVLLQDNMVVSEYDFERINANDIDKIVIQPDAYNGRGSIEIKTKKTKENKSSGSLSASTGVFKKFLDYNADLDFKTKRFYLSAAISHNPIRSIQTSKNFIHKESGLSSDEYKSDIKENYNYQTTLLKLNYSPSEKWDLWLTSVYNNTISTKSYDSFFYGINKRSRSLENSYQLGLFYSVSYKHSNKHSLTYSGAFTDMGSKTKETLRNAYEYGVNFYNLTHLIKWKWRESKKFTGLLAYMHADRATAVYKAERFRQSLDVLSLKALLNFSGPYILLLCGELDRSYLGNIGKTFIHFRPDLSFYYTPSPLRIAFNYSRNIIRPSYTDLMTQRMIGDDLISSIGNSRLKSSQTDDFKVRLSTPFGSHYFSSFVSYGYTNNLIANVFSSVQKLLVAENIGEKHEFSFGTGLSSSFLDSKLSLNLNTSATCSKYKLSDFIQQNYAAVNHDLWVYSASVYMYYAINQSLSMSSQFRFYKLGAFDHEARKAYPSLSLSIDKSFFEGKLRVGMSCRKFFKDDYRYTFNYGKVERYGKSIVDERNIILSLTYKFGKFFMPPQHVHKIEAYDLSN